MTDRLNAAQREAVLTPSGPMLVLAGAGTGKTRVVTHRIAELIRRGTRPERILGVTFTNKAAGEMQERAAALLGKRQRVRPEISTFHSLCVRVLRRNITRLGYPAQFTICDRSDQESLARQALREIRVGNELMRPGELLHWVGRWKNASFAPARAAELAETDEEHLAASGYRRYQQALVARGAVDFDDLLLLTETLLTRFAEVRKAEAGRFDHLLVDEYQDTNGSQYRIVKALAVGHRNLCVVGDDDQSIYGWRGAEISHILRFGEDWPDAKLVRLEENYRSRAPILECANRLIACNRVRHPKELKSTRHEGPSPEIQLFADEVAEAEGVIADLRGRLSRKEVEPRDVAILFRTNEQPRTFESELRRHQLPYVLVGSSSFFDRKEIRDVAAYLKLLVRPDDEASLLRIINVPTRGLGAQAVKGLLTRAVAAGQPLWRLLVSDASLGLSAAAEAGRQQLRQLIERFRERMNSGSLSAEVQSLIAAVGYRDQIDRDYTDPLERIARWNSVQEVFHALASYEQRAKPATLAGFLDELTLSNRDEADEKEKQLERNAIVMMTLHSAKGLEFPHVYLVGMEEGLLPHRRALEVGDSAIDEERRLAYVGVTRARDQLTLTLALARNKWGKPRTSMPSRFLFELKGDEEHPELEAARDAALRHQERARVEAEEMSRILASRNQRPASSAAGRTPAGKHASTARQQPGRGGAGLPGRRGGPPRNR